ncbi:MAG: DUF885 domain-containing protein [Candidatus Limnocylindrales bacterium]
MTATEPTERLAGPLDGRLEELVRARFEALMEQHPVSATFLGIHAYDTQLGSRSREAIEGEIADDRRFVAELEAIDPSGLSASAAFEREIALLGARRGLFDDDVHRLWERRASAMDEVGDGVFSLFARDFAPLAERLESISARLEHVPRLLAEQPSQLGPRPVRLWNELELQSAGQMGSLFDEVVSSAQAEWGSDDPRQGRLRAAVAGAQDAIERYRDWLRGRLADATDELALGRERYDALVDLRAFDGLSSDDILEIGWSQLALMHGARQRVARELHPEASEREVVDRVRSDHPATFVAALEEYRAVMLRARQHLVEHDLVTIPAGESLRVIETPEYLRNVLPFAAYFEAPPFDTHPSGIYVVTPSVDGDPRAMREHSFSSISNTSIHEAYPGHHLQLSAAITHPSLARLLIDAPEFVEGWAMYSEQMMREEGFDTEPRFLVTLYTDAIWRACRIVLDVRLHRGEIGVPEAIEFLVEHTGFERPNAAAEVHRYTMTPTQPLSYLLGKVMLLRLREDEQRRLGPDFSLKCFHDALIYAGSLPISLQRRLLAGEGGGPAVPRPLPRPATSRA